MSTPVSGIPPGVDIERFFGPLISGVWLQQLLLGFIIAQMIDYYRTQYENDGPYNKFCVNSLLFFNIVLGATDFHVLYRSSVLYYGNLDYFDLQEWTMWTEPMFTAIIGFIAQSFFLHRCHRIAKNTPVSIILGILILFSFGAGLSVSGSFIVRKRFSALGLFKLPITLWLISTAVADFGIAAVLVYHLLRSKTLFQKTNTIITKLITLTMETSALTAVVAILNLVLFLPLQDTSFHLLPQFSMSRVYTLTVMVTLLARHDLRVMMDTTVGNTFATSSGIRAQFATRDQTKTGDNAIRVGVTTITDSDSDNRQDASQTKSQSHDIELNSVRNPDRRSTWDEMKPGVL